MKIEWDLVLIGAVIICGLILEARKRRSMKDEAERQRRRANMFLNQGRWPV